MRHFPHLGISETPLLRKMGDDANDELGFQVQGSTEAMLNCPSSGAGMNTDSLSEKVAAMSSGGGGGPSFYGSGGGWDPIASMSSQAENFGAASSMVSRADFASSSYPLMLESQRMDDATSHLVHYPSDPSFSGMVPRLPIYGSGNYSEMVNSFGLRGCAQASNAPQSYNPTRSATIEKVSLDASLGQGNGKISVERAVSGVSLNGKRTMGSSDSPPLASNKDPEADRHRENTVEASEPKEPEEKKQKTEQTPGGNSGAKQTGKQTEDGSQSGEDRKQNYIHVRARRGQATNSHSLAERVRREKISERMRLLQELVPGCNKITGKAVMLDEIINYVQSLQQQVEFLSMKLATVNPELGFDIDRILSKDILNSRGGGSSLLGCNLGMISSHPFTPAIHPGSLTTLQNASSQQYHPVPPQAMWDNDLHNLLQMGFDSNTPTASNLGPNGSSKMEL